jgi:hypothetical protein
MANSQYLITLQSEGANSGPYYVVTYSTGSTYVPVISGSPAYLPNVGSTAFVIIPSASYTTLRFNLNNGIGGDCELCNNDVVYTVAAPGTASVTFEYTAYGLPTGSIMRVLGEGYLHTSASTNYRIAPTSSTAPAFYVTGGGITTNTFTTSTAVITGSVYYSQSYFERSYCRPVSGSQITGSSFSAYVYQNGNLILSQSSGIVSSIIVACATGSSGGRTDYFPITISPRDNIRIVFNDYFTGTAPTPSPTPTPTPSPTPTPTPSPTPPPECVTSVTFDVDEAGDVSYIDCCGTTVTSFYGIGPQVINECMQINTVSGTGALISFITYSSSSCSCVPPPTPSPTPTTYYYYSVKKYDCDGCTYVSPDLVARSSIARSTTNGFYYNPSGDGFVYQIQTEITPAPMSYDIDISSAPSNADCGLACSI